MFDATASFFELIQVAVGKRQMMSSTLTDDQWREVCRIAGKQTLFGLAFIGLDRLPKEQCPSKRPMMWMYNKADTIRQQNEKFNAAIPKVIEHFRKAGFEGTILKGQGMALLYDEPYMRSPGDIDIWLKGSKRDVIRFVRSQCPRADVCYHHIDCGKIEDVDVEAHFTPTWMFNPRHNRIFQQWAEASLDRCLSNFVEMDGAKVSVPDLAFNRVFALIHIYRHLFNEGIGLRQLMDYYFVLNKGFSPAEKEETLEVIENLGLTKFASAVMYVLQKVFLLDDNFLLVAPDESEGDFLLSEILRAGNFGQYDKSNAHSANEGELHSFLRKMARMRKFLTKYPSEVLWSPFFKIWQFFWRKTR